MPSCTERSSSVRPALRAKITHTIYFWVFITSTLHWHLILATIFRCVCLHRYIKRGNTIYMRVAFSHGSYFFSLSFGCRFCAFICPSNCDVICAIALYSGALLVGRNKAKAFYASSIYEIIFMSHFKMIFLTLLWFFTSLRWSARILL